MLDGLKYRLKPWVERSVRLQALAQLAMVRFGWFLPHDADYFGLRHLIDKHDNRLFVDVGANQGTSVLSFRCFDEQTPVVSIEANELHRPTLERLAARDPHFSFHMLACGAGAGSLTLFTPRRRSLLGDQIMHTMTSTNRAQLEEVVRGHFGERFARSVEYDEVTSEVVRFDSLALRPSILKIDTEGAELAVLEGATETIAAERPYILLERAESNFEGCRQLLEAHDYRACGYDRSSDAFQLESVEGRNVYFIPEVALNALPMR